MNIADKKEKLRKMISELVEVPIHEVENSSRLIDDLGMDSLDNIELIMDSEREFNIVVNDSEAEELETVQDCMNLLKKYLVG